MKQSQIVTLSGLILVAPHIGEKWGNTFGTAVMVLGLLMGMLE